MNFKKKLVWILLGWVVMISPAFSEDVKNEETSEGVRDHGVLWNVAKDRKFVKVGGVHNPEGLDIYVERKVNEMREDVARIEVKLEATIKKLDEVLAQRAALPLTSEATTEKPAS